MGLGFCLRFGRENNAQAEVLQRLAKIEQESIAKEEEVLKIFEKKLREEDLVNLQKAKQTWVGASPKEWLGLEAGAVSPQGVHLELHTVEDVVWCCEEILGGS